MISLLFLLKKKYIDEPKKEIEKQERKRQQEEEKQKKVKKIKLKTYELEVEMHKGIMKTGNPETCNQCKNIDIRPGEEAWGNDHITILCGYNPEKLVAIFRFKTFEKWDKFDFRKVPRPFLCPFGPFNKYSS